MAKRAACTCGFRLETEHWKGHGDHRALESLDPRGGEWSIDPWSAYLSLANRLQFFSSDGHWDDVLRRAGVISHHSNALIDMSQPSKDLIHANLDDKGGMAGY